jgi:cation-transporting ATPase E
MLTLDTTNPDVLTVGLVAGLVGMAAVEAAWWITARVRGDSSRLWAAPVRP